MERLIFRNIMSTFFHSRFCGNPGKVSIKSWIPASAGMTINVSFLLILLSICFSSVAYGQPLRPEQAFSFQARQIKADQIEIRFQIAQGYYLYRDKFKFAVESRQIKFGSPQFPPGQVKDDKFFGRKEIFRKEAVIIIPITSMSPRTEQIILSITYQGCSDAGLCYPPKTQKIQLKPLALSSIPSLQGREETGASFKASPSSPETVSQLAKPSFRRSPPKVDEIRNPGNINEIKKPLDPGSRPPSGLGRDDELQHSLSIGEVEGEIFGLLKSNNYFWIILSFFGFGLLLSFTPCVLPMIPIISGIIIAQGKDLRKKRAFSLSLTYVLGMALTYTAAGVAAGYSGRLISAALQNPWILSAFALIFVALALSMFGLYELQIPGSIQTKLTGISNRFQAGTFVGVFFMGLLSAIIISPCVTAPLAGALLYISQANDIWLGGSALFALSLGMGVPLLIIGTSAGILLPKAGAWMKWVKVFFGILLLAVAFWIIYPVISPPLTSSLSFQRLTSLNQLEAQIKETQDRAVMLYVSADWCVSCKEMEILTFRDSRVKEKLNGVKLLKADVTQTNKETDALLKRFGLFGPPAVLFFDQKGREIPGTRVIGVKKADPFLIIVNKAVPR